MRIQILARLVRNREVAVGAVEVSAGSLAFEVIQNIRESVPFQNFRINRERARCDLPIRGGNAHHIAARLLPVGEIGAPEHHPVPSVDVPGGTQRLLQDRFARSNIDQREIPRGRITWVADHHGLLGSLEFVSDLVHEHVDGGGSRGREDTGRENYRADPKQ